MLYKTLKNKTYKILEGHRIEVMGEKYILKTPVGFIHYPTREVFEKYLEDGSLEGRIEEVTYENI